MKIVIVGCGRVGSTLAENLDADGHEVIIFDIRTAAFDRLPETFKGAAIRGDGTDEEVLRRNGADGADIFLSLTEGDNRNVMAAQVAIENVRHPAGHRQDQRPRPGGGLLGARRRHALPDEPDGRHGRPVPEAADADRARHRHPGERPATHASRNPRPTRARCGRQRPSRAAPRPSRPAPSRSRRARARSSPAEADAVRAQRLGFRRWRG